jgi:putative membrane protein
MIWQMTDPGSVAPSSPSAQSILANERTLLAWSRTALTMLAVGVGLRQFGTQLGARALIGALLVALGAASGAVGAWRYVRADRDIRTGQLPVRGGAPVVVAGAIVLVATGVLIAMLTALLS